MSEAIKQAGDALTAVAAYPEIRQYIGTVLHDQIREALAALSAEQPKPVAWLIDWPDEPELGHYFAEEPSEMGRNTPLYASPIAAPASQSDAAAIRNKALEEAVAAVMAKDGYSTLTRNAFAHAIRALATQSEPQQEPTECGACHGSGWVVRDPDIGTDQECFACNGTGRDDDAAPTAQQAGQPAQQEMHLEILRRDQADRVMPLIGPLLDAYEGTQKHDLAELYPDLTRYLKAIVRAIDDDAAPVTAERISCPECKGSGSVNLQGDCSDCNGKGYYWELVDAVPSADALKSAAGQPAPALPDNCVIVPKEPTPEMCFAARRVVAEYPIKDDANSPVVIYRAMINAAPAQEGTTK